MVHKKLEDAMSEEGAEKTYDRLAEMADKYAAQLSENEQESA